MQFGIFAGLTTCALWGLTFVAAGVVEPFSVWDLTIARYGVFGVACAVLMFWRRFRPVGLPFPRLATGLFLGATGHVGYFVCVAFATTLSGAAIPPIIIGTMPVLLAIIANRRDHSAPWRSLILPLALIATGVGIINAATINEAPARDIYPILLGILASVTALAIWIVYGLVNASVMRAKNAPDALQWTGLQGLGAAIGGLMLLPLASFETVNTVSTADIYNFAGWALLMGVAGSWLATCCWVVASRRLPLAFSAQLIVAETIFGLGYGFVFEGRGPSVAETIGALLQIIGVCSAINVFRKFAQPTADEQPLPAAKEANPAI
ncbi:DMT family transporter [Phyllobacterium sp. P30BS-XVII]|uniref:DMT family transporter n=1 Tax=Phyllobacterium sp. P30BS-XVII TaxID=2587046 RepID=UPI0015FDEBA2|nr:DMT family transporter [Phyllobacterium sp. P30BS-XVII]MBA8899272.1 drug/metabolite transporter (DMT)-like permease [Phyllobacterium sp. P30BS-XVII]